MVWVNKNIIIYGCGVSVFIYRHTYIARANPLLQYIVEYIAIAKYYTPDPCKQYFFHCDALLKLSIFWFQMGTGFKGLFHLAQISNPKTNLNQVGKSYVICILKY